MHNEAVKKYEINAVVFDISNIALITICQMIPHAAYTFLNSSRLQKKGCALLDEGQVT